MKTCDFCCRKLINVPFPAACRCVILLIWSWQTRTSKRDSTKFMTNLLLLLSKKSSNRKRVYRNKKRVYSISITSANSFRRHALLFEELEGEYNIPAVANCRSIREFDESFLFFPPLYGLGFWPDF